MATPGLAVVVEVAAVAGIGGEVEVGTGGGVTVHSQVRVSCVQAARELRLMEHIGSQHVHDGSWYSCEDAQDTHDHKSMVLQKKTRGRESLNPLTCGTHHHTLAFLETLLFLKSQLQAQQDKTVDAQRQNLQKNYFSGEISNFFIIIPQAPPRSSQR